MPKIGLPKKESLTVEFKTSFNEDVIETLSAFANTKGGKVLVGVANNGLPVKNFKIGEEIIYNVHLGRFKTPSMIIDDRMLRLPLFEVVEETMKYIISQIKFAFEIKGIPTQRTEIPEYPLDALRELVLNSVIHRDYLNPTDIQIKIFDNYISFFNPGGLHSNLSVDDLKTDSYSAYARNKLIAEAFYLTGDIEKYGSGFLRIRDALSLYPTMKMDFKEIGGGFMVTMSYTKQKTSTYVAKNNIEKGGMKSGMKNTTDNILMLIRDNNSISISDISEKLNISRSAIQKHIENLKSKGLIERVGADKGGYWRESDI